MPVINHRRPNQQRTCLGGRCCLQCGFTCHRHWIARTFPLGIRAGETPTAAWDRQHDHGILPESVLLAERGAVIAGATGWTTEAGAVRLHTNVNPPRGISTGPRNTSYDIVARGRRAPNAPAQPGDVLTTDEEILEALNPIHDHDAPF